MKQRIEKIQKIAGQFKEYENNEEALFKAINNLEPEEVEKLIKEYERVKNDFRPVNLLRFEILNLLKNGQEISEEVVNKVKDKIRRKNTDFFSKYGSTFVESLSTYPEKKGDWFKTWKNPFRIFYVFFFHSQVKNNINSYLTDIAEKIKTDLSLKSYKEHTVSFGGATNFGSSHCWIALFPTQRVSHKKAHQLFLRIEADKIVSGLMPGWDIPDKTTEDITEFHSIEEALNKLKTVKDIADDKNANLKNYWKFAPGDNGKYWEEFHSAGIIAIGWDDLGDLNQYKTKEDLAEILGAKNAKMSNEVSNIENFRDASIGDIIIANKGKSKSLGIGVIVSEYEFDNSRPYYKHKRKVNWLVDQLVYFEKTIFRPDTFSQTLKWDKIKAKYIEEYPELEEILNEIEEKKTYQPEIDFSKIPFQNGAPETLRQIYAVLFFMKIKGKTHTDAFYEAVNFFPDVNYHQAISDKCTRRLNIDVDQFLELYNSGEILSKIIEVYKLNEHDKVIFSDLLIESNAEIVEKGIETNTFSHDINYWWLNAKPKIWSIDSYSKGDIQSYTSHNERGNKRRVYKYFQQVKPGDLVIGYESTPVKQIKAVFEITEGLHQVENEGEIIKFELKEIVADPINWEELKNNAELQKCEVFVNNQGSLFKLSEDEFDIIRDLIDERNIAIESEKEELQIEPYSIDDALEGLFIKKEEFQQILYALDYKKNIVLQGPPGVGKTFIAKRIAYSKMKLKDETKIKMVQFHQSYSYEDFIQGIRPEGNTFEVKNGVFYEFCKKAGRDSSNAYFFIIDEINRGNLSKIFGELMMLIEHDKRGEKFKIPLTYSKKDDEPFFVPENVYIIGTMNTADRSLALVDYALRRRFAFLNLIPKFNDLFNTYLIEENIDSVWIGMITEKINSLNKSISDDKNLGSGFQIGHSYFCNTKMNGSVKNWYDSIINHEIAPLLREYWFDDIERARSEIEKLLNS